jgi:pimeloyl-ACP methyl ester carboxylesterase
MSNSRSGLHVAAPSRCLTALEFRAFWEREAMRWTGPLLERLPRGDGHHVLVLPGFLASDRSTQPLRQLLRDLGYHPHGWRLGSNLGPTPEILGGLDRLFDRLTAEGAPISIVGWSLGGIYARELAYTRPDAVRQVITLGSPIQMVDGDESAVSNLWRSLHPQYDASRINRAEHHLEDLDVDDAALPVPSTAVYTRSDGIVHWSTCLDHPGPRAENVEVVGSHCGLGFNPAVAFVVADRLAQPAGEWRKFRPPPLLRGLYPRPARYRPRLTDHAA